MEGVYELGGGCLSLGGGGPADELGWWWGTSRVPRYFPTTPGVLFRLLLGQAWELRLDPMGRGER